MVMERWTSGERMMMVDLLIASSGPDAFMNQLSPCAPPIIVVPNLQSRKPDCFWGHTVARCLKPQQSPVTHYSWG